MQNKVVVAIPAGDTVHTGFANSLCSMLMHTQSVELADPFVCTVQFYGSSLLPFSRHVLATYALEAGCTHILYIDSDMTFPHWMLTKFMEHDKPIIGINAMARRDPYRNTAQSAPGVEIQTYHDKSLGLERVRRTGFGVMWINVEVFRKMPKPWFDFEYQPDYDVFKGEDFYFCDKAHDLGYEIWIDHDISKHVEHIGIFGYSPLMKSEIMRKTGIQLSRHKPNGGQEGQDDARPE